MAPRARQAKGKARLTHYEDLLGQEQAAEKREGPAEISIPPGPRLGDLVIEAKGVRKGYGDNLLMDDVSFLLPRGGIVGIIGPNGAGKTTLFRMILGQEKPDAGALKIGESVVLSYVDQSRDSLIGTRSVWEEISDGGKDLVMVGKREVNSRAYAASFGFRGPDQQKKVKDLSGGERNRLHLATLLKSGGNLLLLDEPTNDLDGLRGRDQPRPLVPRSHRNPHHGLRGRQPRRVVRRQLPGLRGRPAPPPGRRGRPAAPHPVPEAHSLTQGSC